MKKRFFVLLTALMICLTIDAQFIAQVSLMAPHYYPGEVIFKDGHSEEFAELELPCSGKHSLGVKKNSGDKKHTQIHAEDIIGIKIWHKNFPDQVHVLYYLHANKSMMMNEHQWGVPVMGSAWGVVYQCEIYYKMNKQTGGLDFVKFVGGNNPDTPTLYYLVRDEWEKAELVLVDGVIALTMRKKVSQLFAEKPDIAEGIRKGTLKGSDMQYILDEMANGEKMEDVDTPMPESETESIPETTTDSVSNGVVGDDE